MTCASRMCSHERYSGTTLYCALCLVMNNPSYKPVTDQERREWDALCAAANAFLQEDDEAKP